MWRKTMDYDKLFPGRFIKAGDLNGHDVTVEISEVKIEELDGDGGVKTKGIISFAGKKKGLVLNRTNGECIKAMFGRETDGWIGKRLTLCVGTWDGEPCIRIRGSPDIAEPVTFDLKLPKKKAKRTRMERTTLARTQNGVAATPAEADLLRERIENMDADTAEDVGNDLMAAEKRLPPAVYADLMAAYKARGAEVSP